MTKVILVFAAFVGKSLLIAQPATPTVIAVSTPATVASANDGEMVRSVSIVGLSAIPARSTLTLSIDSTVVYSMVLTGAAGLTISTAGIINDLSIPVEMTLTAPAGETIMSLTLAPLISGVTVRGNTTLLVQGNFNPSLATTVAIGNVIMSASEYSFTGAGDLSVNQSRFAGWYPLSVCQSGTCDSVPVRFVGRDPAPVQSK
jgi:hypothetical protein